MKKLSKFHVEYSNFNILSSTQSNSLIAAPKLSILKGDNIQRFIQGEMYKQLALGETPCCMLNIHFGDVVSEPEHRS